MHEGKIREKQNFLQLREFSPFDSCQGIVREFCHDIFLD